MLPQRYIQLRRIKKGPFKGDPYVPVLLAGQIEFSVPIKGLIVQEAIASTISKTAFHKLFPNLEGWKHHRSPYVRIRLYFPGTMFGKFNLCACERFYIIEDPAWPEDLIYLNERILQPICMVSNIVGEDKVCRLHYPSNWAYNASLLALKSSAVLILGNDRNEEGLWRMRAIQAETGSTSIIVRDYLDIHFQSNEEKVRMFASTCQFAIVEHTFPSGAIDELRICADSRIVTCVLRESGHGATWMQADYELDYANVREFIYSMDPFADNYLPWVVHKACEWARGRLRRKAVILDSLYSWRFQQRVLEEAIYPSYEVSSLLEFWEHLVWDFEETLKSMNLQTAENTKLFEEGVFEERIRVIGKGLTFSLTTHIFSVEARAIGACDIKAIHNKKKDKEIRVLLGTARKILELPGPTRDQVFELGPKNNYLITDDGIEVVTRNILRNWIQEVMAIVESRTGT